MRGIIFAHVEGDQVHLGMDGERKHRCLTLSFAGALESYQGLLLIDLETDDTLMKSRVRTLELHYATCVFDYSVQGPIDLGVLCFVLEVVAS